MRPFAAISGLFCQLLAGLALACSPVSALAQTGLDYLFPWKFGPTSPSATRATNNPPIQQAHVQPFSFGPLYEKFSLTLSPGERQEIAGPLLALQKSESQRLLTLAPVFSYVRDPEVELTEFEIGYPLLSHDRFGTEYRFHIFQIFSISGGHTQSDDSKKRITLFPFYFQQRSTNPQDNYTAVVPFYGRLKNRMFKDEARFIMLPIYLQSRKRDVVTDNYVYPIFHLRKGTGLKGWQVWPLTGRERKVPTEKTNSFDEVELVPGHEKFFLFWPFFFHNNLGLGSTNEQRQRLLLPLYSIQKSPARDTATYIWPFGYTKTVDREKKYREWGMPWPLIVFARGEGKTGDRVWPFFSRMKNPIARSEFYAWPVYKRNRVQSAPLDRDRKRILFFLYSDLIEKNTETGTAFHRTDLWPLFTARRDHTGNERLQLLSILEPLIPNNKSIERNYSPVWSIWRTEKNAASGAKSHSFLWNLYRADLSAERKRHSALFGLFQTEKTSAGRRTRLFFIPFGKKPPANTAQAEN